MHTNQPNITRYFVGVGPLKQQLDRGPHYSTNNVQENVVYNNPNQHCAPRNRATYCDSQQSIGHIHNNTPPPKGVGTLRHTNTSKRIPIKS